MFKGLLLWFDHLFKSKTLIFCFLMQFDTFFSPNAHRELQHNWCIAMYRHIHIVRHTPGWSVPRAGKTCTAHLGPHWLLSIFNYVPACTHMPALLQGASIGVPLRKHTPSNPIARGPFAPGWMGAAAEVGWRHGLAMGMITSLTDHQPHRGRVGRRLFIAVASDHPCISITGCDRSELTCAREHRDIYQTGEKNLSVP